MAAISWCSGFSTQEKSFTVARPPVRFFSDILVQGSLGNDVDFTAQKVFQILAKDDLIQEAAAGFQVDKDIHIALWAGSTPGHGAEETEVRGAVFGSQGQDLATFGLELSFQVQGVPLSKIYI